MSVAVAVALDERPLKKAKVDKIENAPMPTTDKDECEFRNYEDSSRQDIVTNHYKLMRTHQTLEFHDRMVAKYGKFDHAKMTIREAFEVSTLLSARGVASMAVGRRLTKYPNRPSPIFRCWIRTWTPQTRTQTFPTSCTLCRWDGCIAVGGILRLGYVCMGREQPNQRQWTDPPTAFALSVTPARTLCIYADGRGHARGRPAGVVSARRPAARYGQGEWTDSISLITSADPCPHDAPAPEAPLHDCAQARTKVHAQYSVPRGDVWAA